MAVAQAAAATVCANTHGIKGLLPPFPWPFYLIGTRDSFTYELVVKRQQVCSGHYKLPSRFSLPALQTSELHQILDLVFIKWTSGTSELMMWMEIACASNAFPTGHVRQCCLFVGTYLD